jgi:hypothetical protein
MAGSDSQYFEAQGTNTPVYQTQVQSDAGNTANLPVSTAPTQVQQSTPGKPTKKKWSRGKKIAVALVVIVAIAGLGIAGAYLASQNSNNANPFAGEVTIKGDLFSGKWGQLNHPCTIHDPYSPDNKEISAYLVF